MANLKAYILPKLKSNLIQNCFNSSMAPPCAAQLSKSFLIWDKIQDDLLSRDNDTSMTTASDEIINSAEKDAVAWLCANTTQETLMDSCDKLEAHLSYYRSYQAVQLKQQTITSLVRHSVGEEFLTDCGKTKYYLQVHNSIDRLLGGSSTLKNLNFASGVSFSNQMSGVETFVKRFQKAKLEGDLTGMILLSVFGPDVQGE